MARCELALQPTAASCSEALKSSPHAEILQTFLLSVLLLLQHLPSLTQLSPVDGGKKGRISQRITAVESVQLSVLHSPYLSIFKVVLGPDCLSKTFVLNCSSYDSYIVESSTVCHSKCQPLLENWKVRDLTWASFPRNNLAPHTLHPPKLPPIFFFFSPLSFLSARALNVMVHHPPLNQQQQAVPPRPPSQHSHLLPLTYANAGA